MGKKKYCFFSSMKKNVQEVVLYRQAESLIKDGYEVYNVVSDDAPDEIENGVKILSSGYNASNRIKRSLFAAKPLFERLKEVNADVYHTCHVDQLGV